MTGGYDPNSTSADAPLIRAQVAVYEPGNRSDSCRAVPDRGRDMFSPAIRCSCPPDTLAWATAAVPMRPMNIL